MACLIDQELTFNGGSSDGIPGLSYDDSLDYSLFTATVNNVEIPFYEVHWDGDAGYIGFTSGADGDDHIAPWLLINVSNEQDTYIEYAGSDGQPFDGEATVSICEKESDDGSCPDVPLADAIPEKYADYIDSNGNFVPKASSGGGGGGDCPFTTATLSVVDENGEQPDAKVPDIISPIPYIDDGVFVCIIPDSFGDYIVPLYNGEIVIRTVGEILSYSGNIEIGRTMILTGDATISVPTAGNA